MKNSTQLTIKRIFTAIMLMVVFSGSAWAQKWTIYDGGTLPNATIPVFITSSGSFSDAENAIIDDPAITGNKLLQMEVNGTPNTQFFWRMNFASQSITFDQFTIVVRAKGHPERDMALDMDIEFKGKRSRVTIFRDAPLADIRNGSGTDTPLEIDVTTWNTYRFTMTETETRLFINEAVTPVMTFTPATVTSTNNHFRFGDGDSGKSMGADIDWVIWDVTGAYAPGEGAAIPNPVVTPSWNADLSEIKVNDVAIADFDPATTSYSVTLPFGSPVPTITATTADANATYEVTNAADVPGITEILVTAENGITTKKYTIDIEEAPHNWKMYDASTLPNIIVPTFITSSGSFSDAENAIIDDPDVTGNKLLQMEVNGTPNSQFFWRMNFASQSITFDQFTIVVRAKGHPERDMALDMDIEFKGKRSRVTIFRDAPLADIRNGSGTDTPLEIDVTTWNTYRFTMTETETRLFINEAVTPVMTFTPATVTSTNNHFRFGDGDSGKSMGADIDWVVWDITGAYAPGEGDIIPDPVVTPNWDATLTALNIDGNLIEGFDAATTDYEVILTEEVTTLPVISATANDAKATLEITQIDAVPGTAKVAVTAENGVTVKTYNVVFRYVSTDATLSEIKVGETAIENFAPETTEYAVLLPAGTTEVPTITAVATFEGADVVVTPAESLPGTTTIVVTAENGETTKNYTVSLRAIATDATLATLLVNDAAVEGFDPATTTYNVELPAGTTDIPVVTATATDENAEVTITQATALPGSALVSVVAEDETTTIEYTINFTVSTSAELISAVGFKLFPNPATSSITVEIDNAAFGAEIKIICISGREVMRATLYNQSKKIDISELERGMYIMQVKNNGKQTQQLFIKQ